MILSEPSFELYEYAKTQHESCLTKKDCSQEDFIAIFHNYEAAMEAMSSKIASSLTTYDLYCMILAIALLLLVRQVSNTGVYFPYKDVLECALFKFFLLKKVTSVV